MKLNQLLAFSLLFCLCFIGCRDDEYFSDEIEIPIDTGIIVEGNLNGLIVNESNQPISQVLIEVMGRSTLTDDNGFFRLAGINLDNNGSLVTISKEGYFKSYKFAYAEPGKNSYIRHVLPEGGSAAFPNATGMTIGLNGGAELTIAANSVTQLDGSPYNGRVQVRLFYYDPTDSNLASFMPGDLRGTNSNGDLVQLVTYGMMAVELETESGEPLQLTESLPATLRFPIPDNFPVQDSIPMWHLNEDTGHWIEEGISVRQGNFMVAEVTHFSFWNCDAPFPLIELSGTLVDKNGTPISNQLISITTDNMLTGTGHTNENGHFRGKVPQGRNLQLNLNVCENDASSVDLGSFDIDTDLEEVSIDINSQITVRTRLVDCMMGQSITGYAIIRTDISIEVVVTDEDGFISYKLLTCNEGEGTIRGVNIESGGSSEIVKFSLSTSEANLEDLTVCETEAEIGSIDYSLGGETIRLQDGKAIIIDETYLYIYGENPGTEPEKEFVELMFLMRGASHTPLGEGFLIQSSIGGYNENERYLKLSLNPSILDDIPTTLVQDAGDELIGFISNDILELALKLEITQKINTGAIAGIRWLDLNQDGIQQTDEPVSTNLTEFKAVNKNPNQERIRYYQGMPVDADGSYMIHGLVPNEEYKLTWGTGIENIDVSPANQGTEENRDSDFELNSDNIYETEYFLVGEGETIEDVGFGYIGDLSCQITPRCCPVDGMYFHIRNGVAPYTVNLISPTLVYAPMTFDQEEFEIFTMGDYGTYEIEVTDAQGNSCMRTYEHNEYLNEITGQTWIDEGDITGQFDSNDGIIEDTEINLYNDDGELISTTYADPSGRYVFRNLVGDSYRVQVVIPNEYKFIELGNPLESGENHIDPQTGFSHFINVGSWDSDIQYNLNAGFEEK